MKPILFSTDMVRAILEGRKTVTRRAVKPHPKLPYCHEVDGECFWTSKDADDDMMDWWPSYENGLRPPYHPGDILYVRETWAYPSGIEIKNGADPQMYLYKADVFQPAAWDKWRPSIHMPREAARIFLRVTDVRVERLQIIDDEGAKAEGANWRNGKNAGWQEKMCRSAIDRFAEIWDSTIKKVDLALYGWEANPWVWVITFEKLVKGERHE